MHNDAIPDGQSRHALGLLSVWVWLWNTVEKKVKNQTAIAVKVPARNTQTTSRWKGGMKRLVWTL